MPTSSWWRRWRSPRRLPWPSVSFRCWITTSVSHLSSVFLSVFIIVSVSAHSVTHLAHSTCILYVPMQVKIRIKKLKEGYWEVCIDRLDIAVSKFLIRDYSYDELQFCFSKFGMWFDESIKCVEVFCRLHVVILLESLKFPPIICPLAKYTLWLRTAKLSFRCVLYSKWFLDCTYFQTCC